MTTGRRKFVRKVRRAYPDHDLEAVAYCTRPGTNRRQAFVSMVAGALNVVVLGLVDGSFLRAALLGALGAGVGPAGRPGHPPAPSALPDQQAAPRVPEAAVLSC